MRIRNGNSKATGKKPKQPYFSYGHVKKSTKCPARYGTHALQGASLLTPKIGAKVSRTLFSTCSSIYLKVRATSSMACLCKRLINYRKKLFGIESSISAIAHINSAVSLDTYLCEPKTRFSESYCNRDVHAQIVKRRFML